VLILKTCPNGIQLSVYNGLIALEAPLRIATCSDEPHSLHDFVISKLEADGHTIVSFGSFRDGLEAEWAPAAEQAALAVASGDCDEGLFFCWSGTGISMAANKIAGVRAALVGDAVTAADARVWNHANVLCMSNRLLSKEQFESVIGAWFRNYDKEKGASGVDLLNGVDERYRGK
jgi:ribose 5-phosphate isomerase B